MPLHHFLTPYLNTISLHHAFTPCLYTISLHHFFTPFLHTTSLHHGFPLCVNTIAFHHSFTPWLSTMSLPCLYHGFLPWFSTMALDHGFRPFSCCCSIKKQEIGGSGRNQSGRRRRTRRSLTKWHTRKWTRSWFMSMMNATTTSIITALWLACSPRMVIFSKIIPIKSKFLFRFQRGIWKIPLFVGWCCFRHRLRRLCLLHHRRRHGRLWRRRCALWTVRW